jgi:translocation and assembly module TamA
VIFNEAKLKHALEKKILILILLWGAACVAQEEYCDRFLIVGKERINLAPNERSLLCGDKRLEAWDNVTDSQALFHLKTFLQQRGYFNVRTERTADKVQVFLGEKSYASNWEVRDAPPEMDPAIFRNILGNVIRPKLLDDVSARITHFLETRGYPCPQVKTEADLKTGRLWTTVKSGPKQRVTGITEDKIEGLNDGLLRRYDAFLIGEYFNRDFLSLTENRVLEQGILQTTHFNIECKNEGVSLHQRNIAGAPRLLSFGFGINTERWLSGRASWKHSRLGRLGSSIETSLLASFSLQEFTTIADWYFSPALERFHFKPTLTVKREKEKNTEVYTGELRLTPATSWDNQSLGIRAQFGPSLNFVKDVLGVSKGESKYMAFYGDINLSTHPFELWLHNPKEGFQVQARAIGAFRNVLSDFDAKRFDLRMTALWNLLDFDPPFLVVGWRAAVGTTVTPEQADSKRLRTNFKHFLGGSADLRGFAKSEVPSPTGALTSAFTSLEVRFPDLLPWGLEPLTFCDAGMTGARNFELDPTVYWSPGGGLRWASPIGVFRTSVGRGFVSGDAGHPLSGWRVYLSYGEEF